MAAMGTCNEQMELATSDAGQRTCKSKIATLAKTALTAFRELARTSPSRIRQPLG